jgi:squalene-hopene/tetraprenyl-beta-curcumene cyclase
MVHHCVRLVLISSMLYAVAAAPAADRALVSTTPPAGVLPESLAREAAAATARGLDWLAAKQQPGGHWSNADFPALTALALWAFLRDGDAAHAGVVSNALDYLRACIRPDGGIYREVAGRKGGGLSNYNTAICMTVLHATGDPSLTRAVQKARTFIADAQYTGGDVYDGGFGYDANTRRAYTDLMNTAYALEAMRRTQDVEDSRPAGEPRADIDWTKAVDFVTGLQNPAAAGAADAGGFGYSPTDPKAGTVTNAEGVVFFRSYGSMTYAGMLSLIYAGVSRDDPRVRSALDWAGAHWSLDENPGMGAQGLFFFYNILSRCLAAADVDLVPRADGVPVDWRQDLAGTLVARQTIDPESGHGYWVNATSRFWEGDPVLTTAYSLLALQAAAH